MSTRNEQIAKLSEEIRWMRFNLRKLKRAKMNCDCGCYGEQPHYHELVAYDSEGSSDEYYEPGEAKHRRFVARLCRDLRRLKKRLRKLTQGKSQVVVSVSEIRQRNSLPI